MVDAELRASRSDRLLFIVGVAVLPAWLIWTAHIRA